GASRGLPAEHPELHPRSWKVVGAERSTGAAKGPIRREEFYTHSHLPPARRPSSDPSRGRMYRRPWRSQSGPYRVNPVRKLAPHLGRAHPEPNIMFDTALRPVTRIDETSSDQDGARGITCPVALF